MEVLRIINEPTAAALAYGVDKEEDKSQLTRRSAHSTYPFSKSTRLTTAQISKTTAGNNKLGGDDFDEVLIDYLVAEYKKTVLICKRCTSDEQTKGSSRAKIELSGTGQSQVNLPFITMKDGQPGPI